jgi:hypothetical protein
MQADYFRGLKMNYLLFKVGIIDDFKQWLHEKIQTIVNYIRDFFFDIFKAFTDFFKAMLLTVFDILKDVLFFAFDVFMGLAVGLLSVFSNIFNPSMFSNLFQNFPPETLNILGLLGFAECIGLIITSLGIRITLQLIPFTRLGS